MQNDPQWPFSQNKSADLSNSTGKTLYELCYLDASDTVFDARRKFLTDEIVVLQKKYKQIENEALNRLGLPKDNPAAWEEFYAKTLDLSQRIQNYTDELNARPPKKVLGAVISPHFTSAMDKYTRYMRRASKS